MRLFVAADLPEPVVAALADHARAVAAAGGWRAVPAEGLHVTLAFLGERPPEQVSAIAAAVRASLRPAGKLELGGALLLPPRRPRVTAVEVLDPGGSLAALQTGVARALSQIGAYRPERRPFLAHVTVARRTGDPSRSPPGTEWATGRFGLDHVTLYESRLSPRGARYEALARFEA